MTVTLEKCALPTVWTMEFDSLSDAVDELRRHICGVCLDGGEFGERGSVDFVLDGSRYECRDPDILLSTGCGLEFEMRGYVGEWSTPPEDIEINAHRRRSHRKTTEGELLAEAAQA